MVRKREQYFRVIWRLANAETFFYWPDRSLIEVFPEVFADIEYANPPEPIFAPIDPSGWMRRVRDVSVGAVDIPFALRSFYDAWFRDSEAMVRLVERLSAWSGARAKSIEIMSQPRTDSTSRPLGLTPSSIVQGYLWPKPDGIDAKVGWDLGGGQWGERPEQRIRVVDIEFGANLMHESLIDTVTGLGPVSPVDHGTAVLGVVAGDHASGAIKGIVPKAATYFAPVAVPGRPDFVQRDEEILRYLASVLGRGSVILLEREAKKCIGYTFNKPSWSEWLPLEAFASVRHAIAYAVDDRGVNVVECAGNGGCKIDGELGTDPGAVLVTSAHWKSGSRLRYTNFGDRVHLHSWGHGVATAGGLELQEHCIYSSKPSAPSDPNHCYWLSFGGSSSAAAILAGVVAAASSIAIRVGKTWSPRRLRHELVESGYYKSVLSSQQQVGRHPDLRGFINRL